MYDCPQFEDGFQSTLPVRGATMQLVAYLDVRHISIHAPRAGSDMGRHCVLRAITRFQSTLPVRGATISCRVVFCDRISISIHAPRAGSDAIFKRFRMHVIHFNPRSPCGERRAAYASSCKLCRISIHAPRAGSDIPMLALSHCVHHISIHAPRAGSDLHRISSARSS